MSDIEPIAAFIAGSTLGGVAGYLIRIFIEHRLVKSRSTHDRRCGAAREFRAKVNEAMTLFQGTEESWTGCNKTGDAMRNFVSVIDLASKDFAEFFTGIEKKRFIKKWNETKKYCGTTLPRAVNSGDNDLANEAKMVFIKHVNELLSHAKST